MKNLKGKVAVITGAARGIGFALAEASADAGMKLAISDIDPAALAEAKKSLEAKGAETLAFPADVGNASEIEALAAATLKQCGSVDLLFNNAGLFGPPAYLWEQELADWQKTISVNLIGAINGIRTFVPIMLDQETDCHIVNVASVAGHLVQPFLGPYQATKFAMTAITETLYLELQTLDANIGVSLVCPGFTKTNIMGGEAASELSQDETSGDPASMIQSAMTEGVKLGLSPHDVAKQVIEAVKNDKFYVFTHPYALKMIGQRFDQVLGSTNPSLEGELKERFTE